MSPKLRAFLPYVLVVVAWGIGFSMGGGFHTKDGSFAKSAGSNHDAGISDEEARLRVGRVMEPVPDATDDARRHVPWDRERFKRAAAGFSKEGSLLSYARRAMQMTDALTADDFPMVMEAHAEMKGDSKDDFIEGLEFFLVGRWAELDPKAAAEFLIAHKKLGGFIDINGAVLWGVWASKDPAAAATFAKSMGEGGDKGQALKTILETIARSDADSALAFARIHAPELIADGSLSGILGERNKITDPERAARRLESLGIFDDSTTQAMKTAAWEWAKRDRTAAREWALSLPNANARSNALMGIYEGWFESDRKAATAALLAEPRTGVDLKATVEHLAIVWEKDDWQGAAQWINRLPVDAEKTAAAAKMAERLARDDAVAGAQFLVAVPEGPARDAAIAEYVDYSPVDDVEGKMEWALSVSDPARRKATANKVIKRWFSNNPAAAFEWLESGSGMTPEERAAFLSE
ncbi:MAG: hypothetical protein RL088_3042 [Verrucomicrobiota bacterium]|jgi:hypothetical protein